MRETLIVLVALAIAVPAIAARPSNVTRGVYVHSRDLMPARVHLERVRLRLRL